MSAYAHYDAPSFHPVSNGNNLAPLQFYASQPSPQSSFYAARPSLDPGSRNDVAGAIGSGVAGGGGSANAFGGGQIMGEVSWWNAFTPWAGIEGEPPLLQGESPLLTSIEPPRHAHAAFLGWVVRVLELGINFDHILQKSLTVLNPLSTVDVHIMDDADLAGPLVFCFVFATLLLVSGKPQFSYIYGVALIGSTSIYALLNLMSESGIDAYRTASVLGYCLLPLVLLSMLTVVISLDGTIGYVLSALTIIWCSYSASSIFSSVLRLSSQRLLVAYPVGLFFTAFALLSVFDGKGVVVGAKG